MFLHLGCLVWSSLINANKKITVLTKNFITEDYKTRAAEGGEGGGGYRAPDTDMEILQKSLLIFIYTLKSNKFNSNRSMIM